MALPRMHKFILPAGAWLLARIFLLGVFSATDARISYACGCMAIGTNLFAGAFSDNT
jgi:hypothetical protein